MKIAIIPARGGSKRIPRKNIRAFVGKPMIAYSIEAAEKSALFEQVIVSTDDPEIAEIARSYGASVPFMRPQELSDDYTGTGPVVQHAIKWLQEQGTNPDLVCCLYATCPLIQQKYLAQALDKLQERQELDFCFSACHYAFPVQRSLRRDEQGKLCMLFPQHLTTRSQDLAETFHDAGQFYWGKATAWLQGRPMFGPDSDIVLLPRERVVDIDTEEDWQMAEHMYALLNR